MDGIIIKNVAGSCTVLTEGGTYVCKPLGIFRKKKIIPLVGDYVVISTENKTVNTIKPRKNELRRPPVANIDQVIITVATSQPAFNAGLLDRFLVSAEYSSIQPVICVNKIDMDFDKTLFLPYNNAGYTMVYASAFEKQGLDDLRKVMAGKVNVFAGPSGVGKSSLINALFPVLNLETGDLSTKLGRGKHTTRHSEIFPLRQALSDGSCVDTPGFTSLDTANIPKSEIAGLFKEFNEFAQKCKFKNCLHNREVSCGVKDAVGNGISSVRYDSYLKILLNEDNGRGA